MAAFGLAVRTWAAGYINKEHELATQGPYAFTRNPLYVGSLLLGIGATLAGGSWLFVVAFVLFYAVVYGATIRGEAALLEDKFGIEYRHYARHVPLVVPRLTPYTSEAGLERPFRLERWRRNREYEALLGGVAGFLVLTAKMVWF